jgi:hypothetical protein
MANGSAVAVFVAGLAVGALALGRSAEPRVTYSKTVGTAVEFTGQGQVEPAGTVDIPCWGFLLALVLLLVCAGVVWRRKRKRDRETAAESNASRGDVVVIDAKPAP